MAACMWPNMSEAMEKVAKEMLPDMLQQNKPTWMTELSLDTYARLFLPAWLDTGLPIHTSAHLAARL